MADLGNLNALWGYIRFQDFVHFSVLRSYGGYEDLRVDFRLSKNILYL